MGYKAPQNAPLGISLPGNVDSVASGAPSAIPTVPVGTIQNFIDDTRGMGEYIYLPGVAATVAGDVVEYTLNPGSQATIRHSNATASGSGRPVAVATAAVLAAQYGWYQIGGVAIVNTVAGTVAGLAMATATAGQLGNTPDAGDQILNARIDTAVGTPAAGQSYVTLNRPFVQGAIL